MTLPYLHYDVFTAERLLGNQLAVFPDAGGIDPALMQRIAREMNFSESTFVLPAESAGTDVRMRIFTPASELPIAGHPTIGSAFALAHTAAIRQGAARFVFGLNVGAVPVDLEWSGERLRFAWMTQPLPDFGDPVADRTAVAAAIGLADADLDSALPVQRVSCGVPYLLVPLRGREAVDRAVSDSAAWRRMADAIGERLPVYLFTVEEGRDGATAYCRMFAPSFGIAEDPATGSAAGPLGSYLLRHRIVSGDAAGRIAIEQGVAMGRASRIHVAIAGTPEAIAGVRVGGQAVLAARGELYLP